MQEEPYMGFTEGYPFQTYLQSALALGILDSHAQELYPLFCHSWKMVQPWKAVNLWGKEQKGKTWIWMSVVVLFLYYVKLKYTREWNDREV